MTIHRLNINRDHSRTDTGEAWERVHFRRNGLPKRGTIVQGAEYSRRGDGAARLDDRQHNNRAWRE